MTEGISKSDHIVNNPSAALLEPNACCRPSTVPLITPLSKPNRKPPMVATQLIRMMKGVFSPLCAADWPAMDGLLISTLVVVLVFRTGTPVQIYRNGEPIATLKDTQQASVDTGTQALDDRIAAEHHLRPVLGLPAGCGTTTAAATDRADSGTPEAPKDASRALSSAVSVAASCVGPSATPFIPAT